MSLQAENKSQLLTDAILQIVQEEAVFKVLATTVMAEVTNLIDNMVGVNL